MKKSFLLLLSIGILFTSCENQLDNLPVEEIGQELKTKVVVKFNTTKALDVEEASNVFDVSIEELKAYMANQTIMSIPSSNPNARTISQETIEPIVSGTDTVMYLVNYPEGWCLFSGDKRTEAILAYSETGNLSLNDIRNMEGFSYWFTNISDGLKDLKKTVDYEEHSEALKKWVGIDNSISQVAISSVENSDNYVWTFIGTETISTGEENVNSLTETTWGQNAPYNAYAPYWSSTNKTRCKAGCVAVAASQMLYYLHYKIGYPQTMPSVGSCEGYAETNNYTQNFSNFTSDVFEEMKINPSKIALMIGYIGKSLQTNYHIEGSGADPRDIPDLFNSLNISCKEGNPSFDEITSSLQNGIPLIVSGDSISGKGHTWILDGYRRSTYVYDEIYALCNDSLYEATGYVPDDAEIQRVRKIGKQHPYYLMNWGWLGAYNTVYYYAANPWHGYDYNRYLIYDFKQK